MKIQARFYSHTGAFRVTGERTFNSTTELLAAVQETYAPLGFHNFKIVDDGDCDGGRVTATTPGGRGGRNLAAFDFDPGEGEI